MIASGRKSGVKHTLQTNVPWQSSDHVNLLFIIIVNIIIFTQYPDLERK